MNTATREVFYDACGFRFCDCTSLRRRVLRAKACLMKVSDRQIRWAKKLYECFSPRQQRGLWTDDKVAELVRSAEEDFYMWYGHHHVRNRIIGWFWIPLEGM